MQGGRFFEVALAMVCVTAASAAGGCSGEDAPSGSSHPAAAAIRDLQEAFADDDMAAICEGMTPEAQKQAGEIAHGRPSTCERDVEQALEAIAEGGGWGDGGTPVVRRVDVLYRGRATATIEGEDGWLAETALARRGGVWKLAGFFGLPPREFERLEENLRSVPAPLIGPKPIEVVDGAGTACPDVSDRHHPKVTGGCSFRVVGDDVPIRILTPFGGFELANCAVGYRVSVAPPGHGWAYELAFENDEQRGCSDIAPCLADERRPRPWKSRLVADGDGTYLHRIVMCLRTGVGLFAGELVMRLVRDGGGWRVEPTDRGASGFRIDGDLAVTGSGFDIRAGG